MANHNKNRNREGWNWIDYTILAVQILVPIIAILVTVLVETGDDSGQLTIYHKMTIITIGLLTPMVLMQYSIVSGNKKRDTVTQKHEGLLDEINGELNQISPVIENMRTELEKVNPAIDEMKDTLTHIDPILEKVFMTKNDRVMRFAQRRLSEIASQVKFAVDNRRSDILKPREYYDELDYMAQLIMNDKSISGTNFAGEIWAMTSFAINEWVDVDGYESAWTDTLKRLNNEGILTRRLCVVPPALLKRITTSPFVEPTEKEMPQFRGFVGLLNDYYGSDANKGFSQHYVIKNTVDKDVTGARGFFAIKLTNGDLHILTGETVDQYGSLTAELWFDETEIKKFHLRCQKYMDEQYNLEKLIRETSSPTGFIKYLSDNGIKI